MPSIREKTTKTGNKFYEIRVSRGRGKSYLTTRWYPPEGWSRKAIERELAKQAAEFERQVQAGEVVSREEQAEIDRQQVLERAKIKTVKQYGESVFMPAKAVTISENARNAYQGNLDHWVYPALGELKLPEVTSAEITALLLSMQAAGKSQATCIKVYTVLKSLFKMAYMADLIDRNPMDKVERPKPRKDELKKPAEAESYTAGELKYILDCLQNEPLKWQAFMSLLIDTGLRRGETCGLKWEYVDLDARKITVAGNLCYTPAKGVYLDTPKSGKTRTVDIAPGVAALLRELRQEQAARGLSHFVFNQDGSPEPMHPQTPTSYMKKFAQRYGIEGLHPHKLRHPNVKPKTKNKYENFLESAGGTLSKLTDGLSLCPVGPEHKLSYSAGTSRDLVLGDKALRRGKHRKLGGILAAGQGHLAELFQNKGRFVILKAHQIPVLRVGLRKGLQLGDQGVYIAGLASIAVSYSVSSGKPCSFAASLISWDIYQRACVIWPRSYPGVSISSTLVAKMPVSNITSMRTAASSQEMTCAYWTYRALNPMDR